MKQVIKLTGFLLVIIGLVFWGCSEKTTEPGTNPDEESIRSIILENPSYFNTQNHYGEEDTTGGKFSGRSPINTFFWYREILPNPNIQVNIDIIGDSAFVTWTGEFDGILHLFASETFPPDSIIEYTKDFTDKGIRYAIFKRFYSPDEDPQHRRGWRLVELSGAEIISKDVNTVWIDSVRLNCSSYPDTLLNDPLALFEKEDIITLIPEEECTLTVYTNSDSANAAYVFLHSWRRHIQNHRRRFNYIGNGVFTGVWFAPSNLSGAINAIHHCAFDMISRETLKDDTLSYNANAWLFPYKVRVSD